MTTNRDILLDALDQSETKSLTPVQVQKAAFLLAMEMRAFVPPGFYTFEKYNYGPFSAAIYSDLAELEKLGLVSITNPPGRRVRLYELTPAGIAAAHATRASLNGRLATYMSSVVKWVTAQSFTSLVRAIYQRYPEYKENSIFSE